jgi:outer membrane protein assembly factor BamB
VWLGIGERYMRKTSVVLLTLLVVCSGLLWIESPNIAALDLQTSTSLQEDLVLDFSQTQMSFVTPMESWIVFKFKGTNNGKENLLIHFSQYYESPEQVPIGAPQGDTPLAPGESMWFKIVIGGEYEPNMQQTINRTLFMTFSDNNNTYAPEDSTFYITKTIQIKMVNRMTLQGDVLIQGITVDDAGNFIPHAMVEIGGFGARVPLSSDATGHFSYAIAQSPSYFLIAQQVGYRTTTMEIDGSNVQDFYTVSLTPEPSPIAISAALIKKVTGNIGFWRCVATADEQKLLLVNGMENWEDQSLKEESRLYLLETTTGEVLWTHDMGWESWSADITDDGQYAVFATKLEEFETGIEGFTNYIRLLHGTNGSTIWEKHITPENFPETTGGVHYSRGVKFSHDGEYIFVPVHGGYGYLLHRLDGSVKWNTWVGANIREVIFTRDDQYVFIPSGSGWLYKLKVEDGSQVWKQWIGCWAYVNGFDISPNEKYIAVGSKAAYLTVIDASDGSIKFTKDIHGGTATCRFSPDGTTLVAAGDLLTMIALNGTILWRDYQMAEDIRFSSDGKLIAIGNGEVYDASGTQLYDILPGEDRSTKVGWMNENATRYIFAIQDTRTTEEIDTIEIYSIETSKTTGENNEKDGENVGTGTPGFELILFVYVIALGILLKRKRNKR